MNSQNIGKYKKNNVFCQKNIMQLILNISVSDIRCKRRFLFISTFLLLLIVELLFFWKTESIVLVAFNGPVLFLFQSLFINEKANSLEEIAIHLVIPFLYLCLFNSTLSQYELYSFGIPAILLCVYGILILVKGVKHKVDLHISVWVKYLSWFSIILGVLSFVLYLRRENIVNVQFCVYQYIISVFVFTIIYTLLLISNLIIFNIKENSKLLKDSKEEERQNMTIDITTKSGKLVSEYFSVSKDYLNPNFSFEDFALQMGMEKKVLTSVLNHELNISFYNLLALNRVEMAKKLIETQSEIYTLEYIMIESGFRSKSTFNRNFIRIVGMTPSDYRERYFKTEANV